MAGMRAADESADLADEGTCLADKGTCTAGATDDRPAVLLAHATHPRWELGFHLMPPVGWLNDPNGLCQFRGTYHAFFQHTPDWPQSDLRHWRHMTSTDLLHWKDEGIALFPDVPEDRTGAFSGCTWVQHAAAPDGGDLMRVIYTGNVVLPGKFDGVNEGREANQLEVTSTDGRTFSNKRVLLRNSDYPASCTLHVRDPKVWEQDGRAYMLLGTRERGSDQGDVGTCMVYESRDDGTSWNLHNHVRPMRRLGYMWECPNLVRLGGHDFLAVCPQGVPSGEDRFWNRWQAGYIPLDGSVLSTQLADETRFVEWDAGYDFYAPQAFVDERGRTILIGWMGTFDKGWSSAPDGLGWCHCLTLPRELSLGRDGLLRQAPVEELLALRGERHALDVGIPCRIPSGRADVVLEGVRGGGSVSLDDVLVLSFEEGMMTASFTDDAVGQGRPARTVPLGDGLRDLRILVDGSAVEVYVNGGATVFSTRWFPRGDGLEVRCDLCAGSAAAWDMADALGETYR